MQIEEEVNYSVLGCWWKKRYSKKPRERKEATKTREKLIRQLATSTRWDKRCGRIRQQPIQQTDFLRQEEGTNRRGSLTRNKQRGYLWRKWRWGGIIIIISTLQTRENNNITTLNNEREIEEDGDSGQVTLKNWLGGREKRRGEISENKFSNACALCCYLIYSYSSSYTHICALTFNVSSFATEIMLLHVCICASVGLGPSNKNNLTWQHMLACSFYFLMNMRVWQTMK